MFCPLDCWDSCELSFQNGKISSTTFSNFLCYKLNNYFKFSHSYKTPNLDNFIKTLKEIEPKKLLFIKGSGNMGIMQNVTKLFFEKYGATFAVGSTCDGIGEKGIKKGRGVSHILPTWIIKNSKNIIIWGRNPAVTNTHLLPLIKNKNITTIDVIKTKTAKLSNEFYQINPNSDYFLAILLSRIVIEKKLYLNPPTKKYKKLIFSYSKRGLYKKIGFKNVNKLIKNIEEGASVLLGLGVAKCRDCYKTIWAIDSLFYMMDYFGKRDRGVAFLGNSGYGLGNPFEIKHKNIVALFDINLDDYDVVFIQASNPLVSFLNRKEWEKLKDKKTVVFGKYFDETAKIANIFIPTKEFYLKKDVRGSYFYEYVLVNDKSEKGEGISEYELTKYLFKKFNFSGIKSEEEYIKTILDSDLEIVSNNLFRKKVYDKPPYQNLKFNFLNKKFKYKKDSFVIVTSKFDKALNSQFIQDEYLYINPDTSTKYLKGDNLKYKISKDIPKGVILAKGGKIINRYLKAKGEFAYYS